MKKRIKWRKRSNEKNHNIVDQDNIYAGFSAQNVMQYIPEAVGIDSRGYYSFNDRPVIAALVNSVKELKKEIEELKKMNNIILKSYNALPVRVQ